MQWDAHIPLEPTHSVCGLQPGLEAIAIAEGRALGWGEASRTGKQEVRKKSSKTVLGRFRGGRRREDLSLAKTPNVSACSILLEKFIGKPLFSRKFYSECQDGGCRP